MGAKPTFHIADDYVALLELKPAGRTVYGILRANAAFGRNGVPTHVVHVTASWFTEMTRHWDNPIAPATARRGMNELINKGVLLRLNDAQDGTGFLVAFVTDPGEKFEGPVSGFEHARQVSKRCGTRAFYERKEGIPGNPSVTGTRNTRRNSTQGRVPPPQHPADDLMDDGEGNLFPDDDGIGEMGDSPPGNVTSLRGETDSMREFARHLEDRTSRLLDAKLQLMPGACHRLASMARFALDQGWDPQVLAVRLVSRLNPRIHTPEQFLASMLKDVGAPPAASHPKFVHPEPEQLDGVREADVRRAHEPEPEPDLVDEAKMARLAEEYRQRKARRALAGPARVHDR